MWANIEHFKRIQKRWAWWGIGLLIILLGFLIATIAVSNTQRQPRWIQEEARLTELHEIQSAVAAMMADNHLDKLPNPVGTATNDMSAFPDATSVAGSASKAKDPKGNPYQSGDRNGYLLYGHDLTGSNDRAALVNYITWHYTRGTYTVNATGEVTQVTFRYK
jgi:hypothetical protein